MDIRSTTPNNPTDEQLMQCVARDDAQAFDTLLLRHQVAVYNFLRRMVPNAGTAEDLTQECFLRVWRARGSYLPTAMFRTWIFTIARRLAQDQAKQRRIETVPLLAERDSTAGQTQHAQPTGAGAAADPAQIIMARELAALLDRALQELPTELREAVVLRDQEQLAYEQIADIVGCPLGTVKSRLHAARNRLRATIRHWNQETTDPQ
jgi:RNA polymerase sigma-70 factor, ECF subfamily